MPINHLSKQATPVGSLVELLINKLYHNQSLSKRYGEVPVKLQPEFDKGMRTQQEHAGKTIGDLAVYGGLAGLGIGAAYGIPKLLHARNALNKRTRMPPDEMELIGLDKESGWPGVLGEKVVAGAKAFGSGMSNAVYSGIPEQPLDAQGPFGLPPGSLYPLAAGVPIATFAGGAALANWMANKSRKQMLLKRKRELQKQFGNMLEGKSAAAIFLNKAADAYEKKSFSITGTGLALLGGATVAGGLGGYEIGKRIHPNAVKRRMLEEALKKRDKNKTMQFRLIPTTGDMANEGPAPISGLNKDMYTLPVHLPSNRKNTLGTEDAMGLDKVSTLRKIADWRHPSTWLDSLNPNTTMNDPNFQNLMADKMMNKFTASPVGQQFAATAKSLGGAGQRVDEFMSHVNPWVKNLHDAGSWMKGKFNEYIRPIGQQLMAGIPMLAGMLGSQQKAPPTPPPEGQTNTAAPVVEKGPAPAVPTVAPQLQPPPQQNVQPNQPFVPQPVKVNPVPMPGPVIK